MKKRFAYLGVAVLAALFLAVSVQAAPQAPADGMELAYFPKVVIYNHSAHASVGCKTCHHNPPGEDQIQKCSTAGCHDSFDKRDKSEKSFYNMVHGRTKGDPQSCLTCHRAVAKENKDLKKPLTSCRGSKCHP